MSLIKKQRFRIHMKIKKANKNNKGFTLVELIIVVAIIAVLAAVLAPQYLRYVERARQSNDLQNATNLMRAATVVASDPINNISAGSYFVVRWDTSTSTRGPDPSNGTGGITAEVRSATSSAPPLSQAELDVIEAQLLAIMGADSNGSIGDGQSALSQTDDLLFRINTSNGNIEVHTYYRYWVDEIGVSAGIASY